ncbi:hypothetical protein VC83_04049 [Pseudogymnoascus destructans]|uniref:F-box domain-containing protein n=2 Tax=Pseudogymnoascus destructans TaxID=655981 RepID=L8G937_PSED2|nr:uncharacterized protein VC83_04049 [Pseudogymnoascus destructans]ELR08551.1 hypothetical protein GMDG_03246 [Pseudogymnoascus destructans 20631-21]OAF59757.1 hypothetical protein VC83_04049 [Pseudogymnoascus destructans]
MGQYFRLAAPRAREALSGGHKLGEILFNTSPTVLVYLLAVPVQPKKRLAASEVVTKALKTPTALQSGGLASSSKQDGAISSAKRKADTEEQLDFSLRNGKQAKTEATHTPATFCALPRELHELIFGFVKRLKDLACFGLTNTYFWNISHEIIQHRFASELGTWAGKQIVNVGDYTAPGDYPPGLFSPEEEKYLTNKQFQYCDGAGEQHLTPLTLYHLTESSNFEMVEAKEISTQSTRLLGGLMMRCQNSPTDSRIVRSRSKEIIHANDSAFLPRDQAWILRNLTTKEFVTAIGIALDAKYIDGPFIGCIGFGEVVMSRICWSSDPSISMRYTGEIWRGVWAGHRFDITTVSRHEESTKNEKWTDVSKEVAAEIAAIWESEYGADWRNIFAH